MEKANIEEKNKITYKIYTFLIVMYTFFKILSSSYLDTFLGLSVSSWCEFSNFFCTAVLMIIFITQSKIGKEKFLKVIVITIVVGLVLLNVFDKPFFMTYIFIIGFPYGKSINKIGKKLFLAYCIGIGVILMNCFIGNIKDFTMYQHGALRHSCGFLTPNSFSNIVTLGIMIFIFYKNDNWKWYYNIICFTSLYLVYYFTRSRLAFGIGILDLIITNIFFWKSKRTDYIKKIVYFGAKYLIIFLSIVCIITTIYFSKNKNESYVKINDFFTGRLTWMIEYYENYGFKLLGQNIVTVSKQESIEKGIQWSNIDNSYILFSIKYGIIILVGFSYLYYVLGKNLKNNDKYKYAIYVILIALIGLTENTLLTTGYNFSLLFIAELINNYKNNNFLKE